MGTIELPKYIWQIKLAGNFHICTEKHINWFHRKMATLLLGFEYKWVGE